MKDDVHTEPEAEADPVVEEVREVEAEPDIEMPEMQQPYTPTAAPATDIEGKAEILRAALVSAAGSKDARIDQVTNSFVNFPEYQSLPGLMRLLGIHYKSDHPVGKDPRPILDKVFPPANVVPAVPSPIDQVAMLANVVTTMAANSAQQSIFLSQAISKMGKGDSNDLILKLIEANNATMAAKLDAQSQMSQMLVDVMKAQMETVKLENERLRQENLLRGDRDFETRLMDAAENSVDPAFLSELREGRKALVNLAQSAAQNAAQQPPPRVLTEDESARMIAAEEIKDQLRRLVRGEPIPATPGGNGHELMAQQPPQPRGALYFE